MDGARKLVVNVLTIAALLLVAVIVGFATLDDRAVIEVISVPKQLEERGFTGTVAAQRIVDAIRDINRVARTTADRGDVSPTSLESTIPKIDLPVGGLSVAALVSGLRQLLRISATKISGELVVAQLPKEGSTETLSYVLRVRVGNEYGDEIRSDVGNGIEVIHGMLTKAAQQIVEKTRPYIAASYYSSRYKFAPRQEKPHFREQIERMLLICMSSDDKETVARATNLRGITAAYVDHVDQQAIFYYERVKSGTAAYPSSRYNLAEVYRDRVSRLGDETHLALKRGALEFAYNIVRSGIDVDRAPRSRATGEYMAGAVAMERAILFEDQERERWLRTAKDHFDWSIGQDSSNAAAYRRRGLVASCLPKSTKNTIIADLEHAVQLGLKDAGVYWNLAKLYRDIGQESLSAKTLQSAKNRSIDLTKPRDEARGSDCLLGKP